MEFNDTLTFKRAKALADYFVMKGTDPVRIIPVGYGERVPRILDSDIHVPEWKATVPKGAHLTEEYINGLKTNNEKEAAHQLNRRVELVISGFVQNGKNQFFYN